MTTINYNVLRRELATTLTMIDQQITAVKTEAEKKGTRPENLQNEHGDWVMIPLILAKVQATAALVELSKPRR